MIQVLRRGSVGDAVERWQIFLRGLASDSNVIINGTFDLITEIETKAFQSKKGLNPDGIVGPKTLGLAIQNGYAIMQDPTNADDGPNWPAPPEHGSLNPVDREKIFGKFSYTTTPVPGNPEAITITGDWVKKNVTTVKLTQLSNKIPGFPKSSCVSIHTTLAPQFSKLFKAWDDANLTYQILSWGGTWAPRFIRGSRTTLSNHAWATAFDINVQWNMLGAQPALKGQTGSVRELVNIAYDHGFYWGGWFPQRRDGMHFEAYKII